MPCIKFSASVRHVIALFAGIMCLLASPLVLADQHDGLAAARSTIANVTRITTPDGVQERYSVNLGGVEQWISIRGRDRKNPVLLFVHGGPAAPEMPLAWIFQSPWEEYFTVVQWDQRGAGRSYAADTENLTADQIVKDGGELIAHLRAHLGVKKVIVLGQSWGSYVGLRMALDHPEWVHAYVGTGQVINFAEGEKAGYEWTVNKAKADNNTDALADLAAIAPYPNIDGSALIEKIGIERRWSVHYGALMYGRSAYDFDRGVARLSPDYELGDVDKISLGSAISLEPLLRDLESANFDKITDVDFPVIMLLGRHDYTTPSELPARWLRAVRAPKKQIVWFENSAHLVQIEEPGRFLGALVEHVRPIAIEK
ncbi:MAG: alpha/beta hydrolase [Parvularculaceae bacterium]|nr:alpha/beta hydrolase [Parvularculaceae bacterium]